MRLAKAGYYGGSPQAIMQAPANMVLNILHFEAFEKDFETEYDKLNAEKDEPL